MPDILQVVDGDYKAKGYTAGAAISRGHVCSLDSNGRAIPQPITGANIPAAVGVAQDDAAIYQPVSLVYEGVVRVANSSDSAAITVGSAVRVSAFVGTVAATTTYTDTQIIGTVVDPSGIPADGSGLVLLKLR
jgi:hypothetical protein